VLQLSHQPVVLLLCPCVEVLTVEARVLGHDLAVLLHELELAHAALDRFLERVEVGALALLLRRLSAALEGALLARLLLGHVLDALGGGAACDFPMGIGKPGLDLVERRLLGRLEVALDVDGAALALLQLPRYEALVVERREVFDREGRVVEREAPATRSLADHCIGMEW